MFRKTTFITVLLVLALAVAASAQDKVLAKVGDQTLTEDQIMQAAQGELLQLQQQRYSIIERTVTAQVQELLINTEARNRNLTPEELLKVEVEDKAAEVDQALIDEFYEARKSQIRQPKETVEPQIRNFLAFENFRERLENKYPVEIMLDPLRFEVAATGPKKGPDTAAVTIVEFSDFECPFCSRVNPTLAQVREKYGDKVQVVFRQFPLQIHANARKAGEASLCADEQGKFWEMHDAMFADQKNLAVDSLKIMAAGIEGIDAAAFDTCLDSGKHAATVAKDLQEGAAVGVQGTPAFFVNGRFLNGAVPFERFVEVIDDELSRSGK
ncbi:MAG: thioredoxin domain-containing protein [Acidobacteriota bacterium]